MFRVKKETFSYVSTSYKYFLVLGLFVFSGFFAWQTRAEVSISESNDFVPGIQLSKNSLRPFIDESVVIFDFTPNPFNPTPIPAPVNHSPVSEGQTVFIDEDQSIVITLGASDEDGDELLFFLEEGVKFGTLVPEPNSLPFISSKIWTYTPDANFHGVDKFTFYANDGAIDSHLAEVKIIVSSVNDKPLANEDYAVTDKFTSVNIYSLINDEDVDGDDLEIISFTQPLNGEVIFSVVPSTDPSASNAYDLNVDTFEAIISPSLLPTPPATPEPYFTYIPNGKHEGVDYFTYTISDNHGGTSTGMVKITVNAFNNAPVAEQQNIETAKNLPISITLGAYDEDGNDLNYKINTYPEFGTLSLMAIDSFGHNSHYIYRPNTNFIGEDMFTFVANDGSADSQPAKVYIKVGEGMTVVAPMANPGSGSYTSVQNVSLTAADALKINYTTDGTNPTCDTGTTYNLPFAVDVSKTVKAVACYPYDYFSEVASFTYNINIPTPPTGGGGGGGGFLFNQQVLGIQENADCTEIGGYPAGTLLAQENQANATVYYLGVDCKLYVFPDAKTYNTWLENWNSVEKVDVATLDSYEEANQAVTYRPGTKFVTHIYTNKVYAVEPRGTLRWIPTEEIGNAIYGAGWMTKIQDVLPFFFSTSYVTSDQNLSDKFPTGTLIKASDNSTVYYVENGYKRAFADGAFAANNFHSANIITTNVSVYPNGTAINGVENSIANVLEGRDQ